MSDTAINLFVLLIVIVCLLFVLILNDIARANHDWDEKKDDDYYKFPGRQSESRKHDCDIETVYSMRDEQCETMCHGPGTFRTVNGVCVNSMIFDESAVKNNCDARRGVLAYLLGDPQLGRTQLRCLSVDPGIQPDDPDGKNIICGRDGKVSINYLDSFPQISSCECGDGEILVLIANTNAIRRRGACVSAASLPAYANSRLDYDPTIDV